MRQSLTAGRTVVRCHLARVRRSWSFQRPAAPSPSRTRRGKWSVTELERWRELWESPQATQWDDTARGTVAVLVTYESAIFSGSASAWQAQEARYAAEALGLTPRALPGSRRVPLAARATSATCCRPSWPAVRASRSGRTRRRRRWHGCRRG